MAEVRADSSASVDSADSTDCRTGADGRQNSVVLGMPGAGRTTYSWLYEPWRRSRTARRERGGEVLAFAGAAGHAAASAGLASITSSTRSESAPLLAAIHYDTYPLRWVITRGDCDKGGARVLPRDQTDTLHHVAA